MKQTCSIITFLASICLLALGALLAFADTSNKPDYQWVQLGNNGEAFVRAIFKQSRQPCPKIDTLDKQGNQGSVAMQTRAQNMPTDFAVTVCEVRLPLELQSAKLAGKNLALPNKSPQKVVIMGDTGCRLNGYTQQNCNNNPQVDPSEADPWLFTKTIASAVALKPDLVIHVGDYVYREVECSDPERCGGSPWGHNWATWEADFFAPAASLLEAVPWVFARGNHESCEGHGHQRQWRGWYLFLDSQHPLPIDSWSSESDCISRSSPFQIMLDGLHLLVMDSADEADLADYQAVLQQHTSSVPSWLVTHRPLWGIGCCGSDKSLFLDQPPAGIQDDLKKANVELMVSGHLHLFEMLQFNDDLYPAQMIAGGGATELERHVDRNKFKEKLEAINASVQDSEILQKFTFVLVEFQKGGWNIKVIDEDGATEKRTFFIQP